MRRTVYCNVVLVKASREVPALQRGEALKTLLCLEKILASLTRRVMATLLILGLCRGPKLILLDYFKTADTGWNFPLDSV